MSRVQEVNLHDLLMSANSASVERAARLLRPRAGRRPFLSRLLRDFRTRPISDRETRQRDDIDNLIGMYSLLEVACICRFVPNPLPAALRKAALANLTLPEVERFYTEFHPQLLPQAFRRRVAGDGAIFEKEDENIAGDFLFFLNSTRDFEADDDVESLLTFLDDYVIDGESWIDVKRIVQDPKRFIKKMTTPQDEDDLVASAVVGYWKFVAFCLSFHDFLRDLESRPLMQSAVWHYYAYWFDQLKEELGVALQKSLGSVQAMLTQSSFKQAPGEYANAMSSIESQRAAFKDLLSDRYRIGLQAALAGARRFP